MRGRVMYRIRFEPKLRNQHNLGSLNLDFDDGRGALAWNGFALIDAAEYQPVRVTTDLAAKTPLGVKVLLGSDVKGLGFSISYEKLDGVWFPVTFGGEFEIRGLFLYKRTISISLVNKNFRQADVNSTVTYTSIH